MKHYLLIYNTKLPVTPLLVYSYPKLFLQITHELIFVDRFNCIQQHSTHWTWIWCLSKLCNKMSKSSRGLTRHIKWFNNLPHIATQNWLFKCLICGQIYKRDVGLLRHLYNAKIFIGKIAISWKKAIIINIRVNMFIQCFSFSYQVKQLKSKMYK